jgi:hypothetical protein
MHLFHTTKIVAVKEMQHFQLAVSSVV